MPPGPRAPLMGRRGIIATALSFGSVGTGCTVAAGSADSRPPNHRSGGLVNFYRDLRDLTAGRRQRPVVALQLGDSHTANDAFASRMREGLQDRFGAAGRGLLPPGIPFATYAPTLVKVTASPAWSPARSMARSDAGPFGLSGLRQSASAAGIAMALETELPGGLAVAEAEVLRRPGGGSLDVEVDGQRAGRIVTAAPLTEAQFVRLPTRSDSRRVTLRTIGDGPVDILSWSAARTGPGVLFSNLGTIGATIELTNRWTPDVVRMELEHIRPSLLLVAFGTNEGFRPDPDPGYAETYAAAVRRLQAAAPWASILVIGPPDGDWPARREGGAGQPCDSAGPGAAQWRTPPHLDDIRQAQRRVARANGWAFWDWAAAMGGRCAMQAWAQSNPPLALPDHVHLRTAGYRRTADVLLAQLIEGYDQAGQTQGHA
ncbi:MAG TPA: GDSL-type esterase/lipase family protein [Acetobacteraceae bacterium]|nr:GDSL-type esterase/lipase family protein [Acetobacteraceae bacterium]